MSSGVYLSDQNDVDNLMVVLNAAFKEVSVVGGNEKHKVYVGIWNKISKCVKKWSRNRDVNEGRVDEIVKLYESGGLYPLPFIYLAVLKDEGIVCYDGNHRRTALDKVLDMDIECAVDIMFDCQQSDIELMFRLINENIEVPESCFEPIDKEKQIIEQQIKDLVARYVGKYRSLVSNSTKCYSPSFHPELLESDIRKIYNDYNKELSIINIGIILDKMNEAYGKRKYIQHTGKSDAQIGKCRKAGLWLFLMDRRINREHFSCVKSEL